MNALGTLWILALMVLINVDVLGRNLLVMPVRGVTELVSLSIVGIVFLQLADTLRVGRFTRADVLLDRLEARASGIAADALQAFFHLVGFALMVVILLGQLAAAGGGGPSSANMSARWVTSRPRCGRAAGHADRPEHDHGWLCFAAAGGHRPARA
jgi:TRAP-type mannitol/chloroaromatic compound transport system permease small subunit